MSELDQFRNVQSSDTFQQRAEAAEAKVNELLEVLVGAKEYIRQHSREWSPADNALYEKIESALSNVEIVCKNCGHDQGGHKWGICIGCPCPEWKASVAAKAKGGAQ